MCAAEASAQSREWRTCLRDTAESRRDLHNSRRVTSRLSIEGGHTHNKSHNAGMALENVNFAHLLRCPGSTYRIRGTYRFMKKHLQLILWHFFNNFLPKTLLFILPWVCGVWEYKKIMFNFKSFNFIEGIPSTVRLEFSYIKITILNQRYWLKTT
jgi:hypothetical protein